jgi:hypothetical protein
MEAERSFERLTRPDLERLREIARDALSSRILRTPVAGLYADRLILLVLCQGAAQHYVAGAAGVKDLDVWAFFEAGPPKPFPWRPRWTADFVPSHLGRHPAETSFSGRRVDILGRSIPLAPQERADVAALKWLHGRTASAKLLRQRPVIGLYPDVYFLKVLWRPPSRP